MSNARPDSVKLRRELLARQKNEAEKGARRLLDEPGSDPAGEAKKIGAYDTILNKLDPGPSFEKWIAVAVALLCVLILGVLYSLPRGQTKVLLELEAETVSLRLASPFVWPTGMSITPPIQIKGLDHIDSMLFPQPLQSPHGEVWLRISKGETALSELMLAQGGTIEMDIESDRRNLYLNGELSGSLLASGDVHLQAGTQADVTMIGIKERLLGPESLDFTAAGQGAVPTTLALGGKQPFILHNIPVKGLAFVRETRSSVTSSHFVSTIVSGAVGLPEVKERVDLHAGEWLKFEALAGRLTRLGIGEKINIQFEGVAKGIQIGPRGFERTLEPTWLTYLYNQEKLAFVWSAFLFVWGILWSIRKTVFA